MILVVPFVSLFQTYALLTFYFILAIVSFRDTTFPEISGFPEISKKRAVFLYIFLLQYDNKYPVLN